MFYPAGQVCGENSGGRGGARRRDGEVGKGGEGGGRAEPESQPL